MPARLKGSSEYKTNYKWRESYRSKSYKPSPEEMAPPAGKDSTFSGVSSEPPLQHKKRVEGPPTLLSLNYADADAGHNGFALLGPQEKFASNVPYKLKPRGATISSGTHGNINNNAGYFTTDKRAASKDICPVKVRKLDEEQRHQEKAEVHTPTSPPPAPRPVKDTRKDVKKLDKAVVLHSEKQADTLQKSEDAKRKLDAMNAAVQTNMEKEDALAEQEAPANYALMYKAGVAPVRSTKKKSEYQKEFAWKRGFPASPLLTAEQVVYKSSPALSPSKKPVSNTSEYQLQFKAWPIFPEPSVSPRGRAQLRQDKLKRSRSLEVAKAAGSDPVTSSEDPRLIQESRENVPVPPVGYGKLKRPVTEYRANFASPLQYSFDHGAWKGAFPAHLYPGKQPANEAEQEAEKAGEEEGASSWFAEVLELRRRADEYKRRAQGTHFSREHLAQLMAQQASCWDMDSARSGNSLDALALELGPAAALQQRQKKLADALPSPARKECWGKDVKQKENERVGGNRRALSKKKKAKKPEKDLVPEQVKENNDAEISLEEAAVDDENQQKMEAREPKKAWETIIESEQIEGPSHASPLKSGKQRAIRHHLDLTTPSVGGILLSSGEQNAEVVQEEEKAVQTSEDSFGTVTPASPKRSTSVTKLATSPIFGKPTPDTHPLRDDSASVDRVLAMKYIDSPPLPSSLPVKKRVTKKKKRSRLTKPSLLSTVDEQMGRTYKKCEPDFDFGMGPDLGRVDDDVFSDSVMSIASSSSLASEVYSRARHRRDEFWGKFK